VYDTPPSLCLPYTVQVRCVNYTAQSPLLGGVRYSVEWWLCSVWYTVESPFCSVWYTFCGVSDTTEFWNNLFVQLSSAHSTVYDTSLGHHSAVYHTLLNNYFVKYLHEFWAKPEIIPEHLLWDQEKLFDAKNQHSIILWNCPFTPSCIGSIPNKYKIWGFVRKILLLTFYK